MLVRQSKQTGFTLLEMVLAIAIFSIMSAIIYAALKQFVEMRDHIEQRLSDLEQLQIAHILLADDFRFAIARTTKDKDGERDSSVFKLNGDNLVHFATLQKSYLQGSVSLPSNVKWYLSENRLIREAYPRFDLSFASEPIKRIVIRNVEEVEAKAHYIEKEQIKTTSSWNSNNKIPDMIELNIKLSGGQEYIWKFELPQSTNFALGV